MQFNAYEFAYAGEALQHVDASGRGEAIRYNGRNLVVEAEDAKRLEETGVEFAYLHDHECRDGEWRIMTVPVND
jgi:hypothetical protein